MKILSGILIVLIILVTGCSDDPKVQGAVVISVTDKGKLFDFRPQDAIVDWVDGGLNVIEYRMNELTSTMKYRGNISFPNKYFIEANYQYISIFVFVNDDKPEGNIIVKKNDRYYRFVGDKEKVKNVIDWARNEAKIMAVT